ncbi:unnamed protein product [Rangifer tarandus platyrhynchus]|uniref:Uncharacterized protein n=1 Tax=Rangifer tarandus platyrhynchus TaxID=3082113 RepID=A0AC59YV35_RANTA
MKPSVRGAEGAPQGGGNPFNGGDQWGGDRMVPRGQVEFGEVVVLMMMMINTPQLIISSCGPVFREMTCLCTNAARFCSEAACPGAAPLHFWLTLPSRARRSQEQCGQGWQRAVKAQGRQSHGHPASCGAARDSPKPELLLKGGGSGRKASYSLCSWENRSSN